MRAHRRHGLGLVGDQVGGGDQLDPLERVQVPELSGAAEGTDRDPVGDGSADPLDDDVRSPLGTERVERHNRRSASIPRRTLRRGWVGHYSASVAAGASSDGSSNSITSRPR